MFDFSVGGAIALTDAELPEGTEEIVFLSSCAERTIERIALTNRTIRFTAETPGLKLRAAGRHSAFLLSGGEWTFSGFSFEGAGLSENAQYHGGAIDCVGGALAVTNCRFANFGARFSGGAISARTLQGDVSVRDSEFTDNRSASPNGTGGAIYASGRRNGSPVTLRISDSRFSGNRALSGGAVMTVPTAYDEEAPVRLVVEGTRFEQNAADYSGGAVYAQGDVSVTNALFRENTAGVQGGAMCLGGYSAQTASKCRIFPQTVFSNNRVLNAVEWTCGGAVALWGEGSVLEVDGRHVRFEGNEATSGAGGFGGAVFAASGTVSRLSFAQFNANRADHAGGAVCVWGGEVALSTCVFSNDEVRAESGYGGAVAADNARLFITNNTVRFANRVAVDAYDSETEIVNCVVVDNGDQPDVAVYGDAATLRMEYTAYGVAAASHEVLETLTTNRCIRGVTAAVYRGTTLLLDTSFYNPAASEGMAQDAFDHRSVAYGWQGRTGYSMGAFECPAPDDEPAVELLRTAWFHNRADGLYYPQVTLRFLGGDARRLERVVLVCNGVEHALPDGCLAMLRAAAEKNQEFAFGVDEAHWRASADSKEGFGYVVGWTNETQRSELLLFSVEDAERSSVSVVGAHAPLTMVVDVAHPPAALAAVPRRLSAAALPKTVTLPARFAEFAVDGVVSGRADAAANAAVGLYGCAALGSPWRFLGVVDLDAEGRFEWTVPPDCRFFRLRAEVPR